MNVLPVWTDNNVLSDVHAKKQLLSSSKQTKQHKFQPVIFTYHSSTECHLLESLLPTIKE